MAATVKILALAGLLCAMPTLSACSQSGTDEAATAEANKMGSDLQDSVSDMGTTMGQSASEMGETVQDAARDVGSAVADPTSDTAGGAAQNNL